MLSRWGREGVHSEEGVHRVYWPGLGEEEEEEEELMVEVEKEEDKEE